MDASADSTPIALTGAEFVAVDCETNARGGEACELTEVAIVLVGGGECHEEFSSLISGRNALPRGAQRITGITPAMLVDAPAPEQVLPRVLERLRGRVMVAHNASFDRRVLRQACQRAGLDWPEPPTLCTVAMARLLLPLQRQRALGPLADALGIEVEGRHRALSDARTCARVLCALLPRLFAQAATVTDAVALLSGPRRRGRGRPRPAGAHALAPAPAPQTSTPDFARLPGDPGVYIFRDGGGRPLYVGKSVCVRRRARAHFAPSAPEAPWRDHAEVVDYRTTTSELGALVLENRLIKELAPPGNRALNRRRDGLFYVRCRLDIAYPVLEVAPDPAPGHAVNVGPLRGRHAALELVEQLESLFGLRHCGRVLPRRQHPSAYGQMGRCLSPCLGDLDPNLYRRRLDAALAPFLGAEPSGAGLLAHVQKQMHGACASQRYERAAALRRRLQRLRGLLNRVDGVLRATHAVPAIVLDSHPQGTGHEAFWLVDGLVAHFEPLAPGAPDARTLAGLRDRTRAVLDAHPGNRGTGGGHVAVEHLDELRLVSSWLAAHPHAPLLSLRPRPDSPTLVAFFG